MRKLYSAIALCIGLLVFEAAVFLPSVSADADLVEGLLALPAPPPPNPLAEPTGRKRDAKFYDDKNIPSDNAPISDILDYWGRQADEAQELRFTPEASAKTLARIKHEIERKPALLPRYLDVFPDGDDSSVFVKAVYDRESTSGAYDRDVREVIKRWMTYHTPYYSNDLYRIANGAGDNESYVDNHRDLLALVRVDFDKARPIISRLESNSSGKPSRSLAAWANYRHALDTDSTGDIEQYRDELKAIVENKSYTGPSRDLAMDALVGEKEWAGRDEWYMSLLGDESLADLNGYTGLTTLMLVSPAEKYVDRMVAMVESNDPVVRAAAIRNLLTRIGAGNPEIIKVMLPWLEDPKWAVEHNNERETIVNALRELKIPESVPGLIKTLDEKQVNKYLGMSNSANMAFNAMTPASNRAATAVANTARSSISAVASNSSGTVDYVYPLRYSAVFGLMAQEDPRAVPPLRRLLNEMFGYERNTIVKALLKCKGFTATEQLEALEAAVRAGDPEPDYANSNTNAVVYDYDKHVPLTHKLLNKILGEQLMEATEVGDDLATAVIARIAALDDRDRLTADQLRGVVLRWQNPAVNAMLLQDIKRDRSSVDAAIRLLSQRGDLRAKQPNDVYDLNTGTPTSIGFAACMIEDAGQYAAIVSGNNIKARSALYACARMIRAPLAVDRVVADMRSSDKQLALAAQRYLESEDSAAARVAVMSIHPGEAFVTGARYAFFNEDTQPQSLTNEHLSALFGSIEPDSDRKLPYDWSSATELADHEKELRKEVLADPSILGIYSFKDNVIRIYQDRVIYQWDNDGSRFRERPLSKDEFDYLKSYLAANRVDDLKPFLNCDDDMYCKGEELLMMGKNGGRRVFVAADPLPPFFDGLDKYFGELKLGKGTVKYALSNDIPGLEILLADDDLHVETVWKNGDDLRAAVSDNRTRKRIRDEIEKTVDNTLEAAAANGTDAPSQYELRLQLTDKHKYDRFSWIKVVNGANAGPTTQPSGVEIIPLRDGHAVQPDVDQWKSRAAGFELRPDGTGLFKVAGGRVSKLLKGNFEKTVVTPNGRWAVGFRYGDDDGASLVRINLLTNREYSINVEEYSVYYPLAYIPTLNKVLIVEQGNDYEGEDYDVDETYADVVDDDPSGSSMQLVDPATGLLQPASGEFRPLTQQTFRPLQKTTVPNEFWAAIPDSKENKTVVGIYDIKTFGFKTILTLPKMTFNSMSMWVDEAGKCIYFVYRGDLLKLPLGK